MKNSIIRGRTLTFNRKPSSANDTGSFNYSDDSAILIKDGIIEKIGSFEEIKSKLPNNINIIDHRPNLIVPGFIDTHLHFPQVQIVASYASNLLEWLNKYTFIEEQKYRNISHSKAMAKKFFDTLINHGTTTAAAYCAVYPESVEAFFQESHDRNMLMLGGKVLMDRNAPKDLLDTPKSSYDDTNRLIKKWHGTGRQLYAISPRFAITSSPEQLEISKILLKENPDCYLQTHLSENKNEIDLAKKLYPNIRDYTGIYEHYEILGSKSLFGHCIHLSEREIKILSDSKSVAIFCPTSNLFLGSGLFDFKSIFENKTRIGTATDIGGGTNFSMLKTMDEAHKILQLQSQKLTPLESFYQLTLGNASALSLQEKIGTLEIGSDADIVVLDSSSTSAMKIRMKTVDNLLEELFILQTMGDDRAISQVYVKGVQFKNS